MSLKVSWWSLSATRAKKSTTILFRVAMIIAPLMIGFGTSYYMAPLVPFVIAMTIGLLVAALCYIPLAKTTKAERKEVRDLLNDSDYLKAGIQVDAPLQSHFMKLSYFPDTKEWIASGHLDQTNFVREIQSRDMLADSYHESELTPYVRHVYSSYEFAPKLKRHALKVLESNLPNTNPITIVRIPPVE